MQDKHEQNLSWCKGSDVDLKMAGCTALINSPQETPQNLAIAYLNRGNALAENGQIDIAIKDYDQAIKNNPLSAEALSRRGFALEQRGSSISPPRIPTRPSSSIPKTRRPSPTAVTFTATRRIDAAIMDFNEAVKLDPNDARTYRLRASAYREKSQYDLAIQDCDQAIKLDPNDAVAYYVADCPSRKRRQVGQQS